jgi:hypothetical protein
MKNKGQQKTLHEQSSELSGSIKGWYFSTSWANISFWKRNLLLEVS